MGSLAKLLKKLDVNPETEDTFLVRTKTGAFVSVITITIMATLFWGEFKLYKNYTRIEDMVIDKETRDMTRVNMSISFPFIPCDLLQVGYRDALGNDRTDIANEIRKTNLDVNGNSIGVTDKTKISVSVPTKEEILETTAHEETEKPLECGDCFGAGDPGECCNTCEDLMNAYRKKRWDVRGVVGSAKQCIGIDYMSKWENGVEKGCLVEGTMFVSKVQGHMYIIPGRVNELVNRMEIQKVYPVVKINITHIIHEFSLGDSIPGQTSPFGHHGMMVATQSAMYQYFVNAIPTTYIDALGHTTNTYQVTETHHQRPLEASSSLIPGVYFVYEFSPLRSVIKENHLRLFELCTSLCAILGGVFTVMGIVDSTIYTLLKKVQSRSQSAESELIQKAISKSD